MEEYAAEEIALNYVYASTIHSFIPSDVAGMFDIIMLAPAAKMVKKNVKKSQISIIIIYIMSRFLQSSFYCWAVYITISS